MKKIEKGDLLKFKCDGENRLVENWLVVNPCATIKELQKWMGTDYYVFSDAILIKILNINEPDRPGWLDPNNLSGITNLGNKKLAKLLFLD